MFNREDIVHDSCIAEQASRKLYSNKVLDNDEKSAGVLLQCYKESLSTTDLEKE